MGVRVYELARTLGRSSKDLMHELKKQGIDLKSHMSSIDEETAELVADLLKASPQPLVKDTLVASPAAEEEEESIENTLSTSPAAVTAETAVAAPTERSMPISRRIDDDDSSAPPARPTRTLHGA